MDNPNSKSLPISEGDYLAAWYGQKLYIGQVLVVDKEDGELYFNFMEQCPTTPPTYKWPDFTDCVWIKPQSVVCKITAPIPKERSKRAFTLSKAVRKRVGSLV